MSEMIQPFHRPPDAPESPGWLVWTLRAMQAHFLVAGAATLLGAVGLLGYLYWLEFRRIHLGLSLRIAHPGDIYRPALQWQLALVVVLAVISLVQLQAARWLNQRRRAGLRWGRVAAVLLWVGLPAGVLVWMLVSSSPDASDDSGLIQDAIRNVSWAAYAAAVLLFLQSALAVWYVIASGLRAMRRACPVQDAGSHAVLRWLGYGLITAGIVALVGLGLGLGVLTDWLYEVPVSDPQPGELLYATTFEALNDEWDIYTGRDAAEIMAASGLGAGDVGRANTPIAGETLVVTYSAIETNKVAWSVLDRKYRDMDLRVTVQRISGPLDNQFGVIFRYRDAENFYIFRVSSDGYYSLIKVQDGISETISEWGLSDSIHQDVEEQAETSSLFHAVNTIRVVTRDDRFRFFVNGQPMPLCLKGDNENSMWETGVCTTSELTYVYQDDDFWQGRVALAAGSSNDLSSPVVIAFDDVLITGPSVGVME